MVDVLVVGAGFGGLGTAIRLKQAGIDDFVVLDRAEDIGGTWRVNTYPGAQCGASPRSSIHSLLHPVPNWTRLYPLQQEIHDYLRACTENFGIVPASRDGVTTCGTRPWDDDSQVWHVTTSRGTWEARILVGAMGPFSEPAVPDLPGTCELSRRCLSLGGLGSRARSRRRRVAVIGTGASAVQIHPPNPADRRFDDSVPADPDVDTSAPRPTDGRMAPEIVRAGTCCPAAGTDRSRSGPRGDGSRIRVQAGATERAGGTRPRPPAPPDPQSRTADKTYAHLCVRLQTTNVFQLLLSGARATERGRGHRRNSGMRSNGIVTEDGVLHEVDTIVLGTGFRLTDNPAFDVVRGRDGRTLAEAWNGNARAYLGTTISGFPNFFMLLGPNSVVYTSQVVTIEAQIRTSSVVCRK